MLALCDGSIANQGKLDPNLGVYWRAVWRRGFLAAELERYAALFFEISEKLNEEKLYPEALLQRLDDDWITELPSSQEAFNYLINPRYVRFWLARLGTDQGRTLEQLAQYLMSCMPACRARRRERSHSFEYDVVCAMEGMDVDFRSELGRHFVCECKDWSEPANVGAMAKFCRVLEFDKIPFWNSIFKKWHYGNG